MMEISYVVINFFTAHREVYDPFVSTGIIPAVSLCNLGSSWLRGLTIPTEPILTIDGQDCAIGIMYGTHLKQEPHTAPRGGR